MGAQQSVDLKDFQTKEDLKNFMTKMEEDNKKILKQNEELQNNLDGTQTNEKLVQFVHDLSDADCKCNAPKLVYWLSENQRENCTQARMKAFSSMVELSTSMADSGKLTNALTNNQEYSARLADLLKNNEKYTS